MLIVCAAPQSHASTEHPAISLQSLISQVPPHLNPCSSIGPNMLRVIRNCKLDSTHHEFAVTACLLLLLALVS